MPQGWSVAAMYGIATSPTGIRKEYGIEAARRLTERTEAFVQGFRDDEGDMRGAVGFRVKF